MIALWWTIGSVGYLLMAVAVSCGLYWSMEHTDPPWDAGWSMVAALIWPVLFAVAPFVAIGMGWYELVRLPDRRKERAAKTAKNIRVLESEIYHDQVMRRYEDLRREDLRQRGWPGPMEPWE